MKQELVTVVIPIYNVEKYLDRCLNSVVNQTYKNLEIILVDDGSPDKCPKMCEKWATKDQRIKVIHKENTGLGMARNTGIENATGKYICFFDSDDYIALNTIEKAYNLVQRTEAEIVLFGSYTVNLENKVIKSLIPTTDKEVYESNEIQSILLPDILSVNPNTGKKSNLNVTAWSCLYSMNLINKTNWRFVSERQYISEDLYSLLILYKSVKKVAILKEGLYYYCINETSLTQTFRIDRYEKTKFCHDACQNLCEELNYKEDIKERLNFRHLTNVVVCLKKIVNSSNKTKEKKNMVKEIIKDPHFQSIVHTLNLKKGALQKYIFIKAARWKMCNVVYFLLRVKY